MINWPQKNGLKCSIHRPLALLYTLTLWAITLRSCGWARERRTRPGARDRAYPLPPPQLPLLLCGAQSRISTLVQLCGLSDIIDFNITNTLKMAGRLK